MTNFNFKDPNTGELFFFRKYRISIKNGEKIYKDENGKEILNPKNNTKLELIIEERPIEAPYLIKGNNKDNMKNMLKKRAKEHFKKEIEPIKHEKLQKLKESVKS